MIFRLLLLLVIPVFAYMGVKSLNRRFNLSRTQFNILFITTIALMAIIIMVVMGRLPVHFILAPLTVFFTLTLRALPSLMRLLPLWQMFRSRSAMGSGSATRKNSTIRTSYFDMELNHSSGKMDGSILAGSFAGRKLSELTLEQLAELYSQCASDLDSVQVLEAYLDRSHPDWRESVDEREQGDSAPDGISNEPDMNQELALEILGLTAPVTKEEVTKAHRVLMQKMHPDRGGSDYLAKKINLAKDYLLDVL